MKKNFENQNCAIFETFLDKFGGSDDYMIYWKRYDFHRICDAQLAHNFLNGIYFTSCDLAISIYEKWSL